MQEVGGQHENKTQNETHNSREGSYLHEPYLTLNYEYVSERHKYLQAGIIAMNAHGINRCES